MSLTLPPVAPNTFRNAPPEGRVARRAMKHRDARLKVIMGNRREGHVRYDVRENSVEHLPQGSGWIPEAERLRTDTGDEVKRLDNVAKARRQAKWDLHRSMGRQREVGSIERQAAAAQKEQNRNEALPGTSIRNASSVRYNITNHTFSDTKAEAIARYKDSCIQYSATCRAKMLLRKNNMAGYNILNGQPIPDESFRPPSKPQPPAV
ncbi:hypothetical protein DIPPA_22417 [Diplonema papillatum]|nr:hypothetical protein DIPPA_22417 [Diplonema papillatum]|eukprot:gene173-271_t